MIPYDPNLPQWFQHDAEGRIHMTGSCRPVPEPFYPEWTVREGVATLDMHYNAEDGEAQDRPELTLPATHSLATNADWLIPVTVPAGTTVLIDGASAGETDGGDLVLSFPESGSWSLELRPPFPWRAATCEVTVT